MKEKIKSMNLIQIISNILMLITVIGSIFSKNNIKDVMISLYWLSVTINIFGLMLFLGKWTKSGINADVHKSRRILEELSNITMAFIVCYVLVYLGIVFIQNMNDSLTDNIYVIVCFYLFTIVAEIIAFIVEEKAYKETLKVIKKNRVGKNDTCDTKK